MVRCELDAAAREDQCWPMLRPKTRHVRLRDARPTYLQQVVETILFRGFPGRKMAGSFRAGFPDGRQINPCLTRSSGIRLSGSCST